MSALTLRIRDLEARGLSGVGPGSILKTLREARELIEHLESERETALRVVRDETVPVPAATAEERWAQ